MRPFSHWLENDGLLFLNPVSKSEPAACGLWVTFRKDILTEEYLRSLGLNERQVMTILYVREKGRMTDAAYQQLCKVSKRTASMELGEPGMKGLLDRFPAKKELVLV